MQVSILFYSFISGIMFGIGFDVYRILFKNIEYKFLKTILDLLYWVLMGLIIFMFLLNTQYAILSFYTYFYIFLGSIFYIKCISIFIYNVIKKLVFFILDTITYVFKNLIYVILRIINKKNY